MVVLALLNAHAAPPPIAALVWARRFRLETPTVYRHTPEPRAVATGWLFELRVAPSLQTPHPAGYPTLLVDTVAAVRVNWGSPCVVAWVPDPASPAPPLDLHTQPIFPGPVELPERLDPARAAAARERAGDVPAHRRDVDTRTLDLPDLTALMRVAADRVDACVAP